MTRPGFSFLVCPDAELIRQRIDGMAAEAASSAAYERRVFWGDEGLTPAFWEALTLQSLLGTPRMLVMRHAQNLNAEAWRELSPHLSRFHDQAWPVFCLEGEFSRGKPRIPKPLEKQKYWEFGRNKNWVWQSPGLNEKGLRAMIERWAKDSGRTLAPGTLNALLGSLPLDASFVARELDKLELALGKETTVTARMAELVTFSPDMEIFAFIDALQRGDAPDEVWRKILRNRLTSVDMCFPFLGMVLREARILWQLLYQDGSVRLPPRVLNQKRDLARRLGPERLARVWDLAWEAEAGIKSGERNTDQALEMLVAGLTKTFASSRRPGPARSTGRFGPRSP